MEKCTKTSYNQLVVKGKCLNGQNYFLNGRIQNMRMTKKVTAMALASMMALSLAGCGSSSTTATTAAATEAAKETTAAATEAAKEAAKAAKESKKTETTQGEAVSAGADDLTLLAAIIECEAGGESYECQLAVGAAVINRVKSGSYPNSISGVIYQKGQFGPASSGKLARKLSGRISSSCYSAAQEAMSGVDNTGGCTSFNDHGSGISIGNMKFR